MMRLLPLLALFSALALLASSASAGSRDLRPSHLRFIFTDYEPHLDAETMKVHWGRHAVAYGEKASAAIKTLLLDPAVSDELKTIANAGLQSAQLDQLLSAVKKPGALENPTLKRTILNHGGGFANHEDFFASLKPIGGGRGPTSAKLSGMITQTFGSFEKFRRAFNAEAMGLFGSGWVFLVQDLKTSALKIHTTANQDRPDAEHFRVLLPFDVWEHAYYLKYQNRKTQWIEAFWNIVDWDVVTERLHLGPFASQEAPKEPEALKDTEFKSCESEDSCSA